MACLSENMIQELVTGTLSEEARAQAHLHIERCATCRILVVELARDEDLEARDVGSVRKEEVTQATTLGRYRLEREIGAGAMGVVHAAFDPNLERRIALKVLRGSATFEARERLLREARAMARLVHPNVVTVYEVGFADGRDFIAMELIHGESLAEWLRQAKRTVRMIKRAQILLAVDAGSKDEAIAQNVGVGTSTVYRTKQRFVEEGLERALHESPRPGAPRKLGASDESLLAAVACSKPPDGRARWTLDLLAGEMVRLTSHETLSGDTVGRRLAEMMLKPWQEKMWCIPTVSPEFVARMEDVLELYAEPPDPLRPVVCFDETPRQLIGEDRVPIRAEPGKPRRYDYEYVRNGTANVFMFVDVNRPWRHAKVTDQRTCIDFAECMRDLVDEHYPEAERIRVVLDNLSAHSAAALYQAFEPAEARRIINRLEFHFTPKHASWLNMVEIEIGVMVGQCLDRRIPDKATLIKEIAAWELRRNAEKARIKWMFTVDRARAKMGRVYPQPTARPSQAAA